MRRHFKMAFGSWLAATVAALGQAPAQQPAKQAAPVQQVRYVTPFATHLSESNQQGGPVIQYVAVQPGANGSAQVPGTVQYLPVQAMGNGQYMMVQPTSNTMSAPAMNNGGYLPVQPASSSMQAQTMNNGGYVPVQPSASGMMMSTQTAEPALSSNIAMPSQMASNMPTQTTVQYVPLQPTAATPQGGTMTSTPAIQYIPVHAVQQPQPGVTAQQSAVIVGQGCANGTCANGTCNGACEAPSCCNNCQPCGPCGRVWVSGEYLLWWTQGFGVPPLVTSSPAGTPTSQAAVLGQPGTTVLFGDELLNNGVRSGFRIRAGAWLDNCQTCGIEGSYFFLGEEGDGFSSGPNNSLITGRPFYNANLPGTPPDAESVNVPNDISGYIEVGSGTELQGFDVNLRKNCACDCCNRIDLLAGFRYLRLEDDLTIREDLTVIGTATGVPVGTRFQIYDNFHTLNEFYGGQVGLTGEHRRGQYYVNWRGLIAMGTTSKTVDITGTTTITPPGGTATTYPAGVLASGTNIGHYGKNDFSIVPEINLNLGYQASENLRVFVGYTFLYWSNVTRPGDVIDVVINPTQFPPGTLVGAPRPQFVWQDSDFWAQGVSFGAELRY